MTVSITTQRIEYAGTGSQYDYAVPFMFYDKSHLDVFVAGSLMLLDVDYTVAGAGLGSGTVTFAVAPALDDSVVILRDTPRTQEVDYQQSTKFPADSHELSLDKLTLILQDILERIGRVLSLPPESLYNGLTVPDPSPGTALVWNDSGTGLVNSTFKADGDFPVGSNIDYGSAPPATGTWPLAFMRFNTAPVPGGNIGWVCTQAGTPGTWKEWGVINA